MFDTNLFSTKLRAFVNKSPERLEQNNFLIGIQTHNYRENNNGIIRHL